MNENDKSCSGLQTAVDFAHAARAAKRIMQAAAASGVHGAAAATAREAFPLLLKVLIAVLVVFIAVPMVIFTALPNIFFGYNSSGTDTVVQMTQQAMTLGGVYMTLGIFEGAQIDSVVTGIAAEYEKNGTTIDHIVVSSAMTDDDLLWVIAINSAAHQQDLNTMSADLIRNFCKSSLSYTPSLSFMDSGDDGVVTTLRIEVKHLDPEKLMDELGFDSEARQWAGALYETLEESDAINKYKSYYEAYQPGYGGDGPYSGDVEYGSGYDNEIDISGFVDPSTKNNLDLAAYAIQAWANNWGYVWGTYVRTAYKEAEHELQKVLRTDRKAAQKILSTYLNLLTVYPDQPYDQPEVVHPINGMPIVTPKNCGDFSRLLPKEERVLELVRQKAANGERVLIYTSWTRTDSQKKLQKLLCSEGYRTEILTPQIATDKREDWVNKRVKGGLQVLITNPRCVETGLDLNAFTTIIFYSMGYNLFTLRQASRRSWRINQTAPRVEVYMLYYADTMQAKAMKLMASKLAVAGIIEGTFSEEGLAAMSDVKDLTSQMAKELALGIRDNVEDIAAAFRKMAVMNPERKKNIAAAQLKETAAEEQKAPAAKDSFGVRTAQAQVRQALYEGLLARTAEEQKKRKSKKAEVDENQLSIFGFAA